MKYRIVSFIITEATRGKRGKETLVPLSSKSTPHYFEKSVPSQFLLGEKEIFIEKKKIRLVAKTYHPDAILIEGMTEVEDIFSSGLLEFKDKIHDAAYEYAKSFGGKEHPAEEYTIYEISDYKEDPEETILKDNREKIAGLLKSERLLLHPKEVDYSLSFHFHYSKNDLIIVDWDGAVLFDPEGKTGDIIELIELANYQLLRYRILDHNLSDRLQKANNLIEKAGQRKLKIFAGKEIENEFKEIMKIQSESIIQFETVEKEIKLIGDWYSARVYSLLSTKFRLDGWRQAIREKLESIETIYTIAAENLNMSKNKRLELIQIQAFFVLQVGWLVLIVLEFIQLVEK